MRNSIYISIFFMAIAIFSNNAKAAYLADSLSVNENASEQYKLLQKAVLQYEKLKEKDPWNEISLGTETELKLNDRSEVIKKIRTRLELLGDFRALRNPDVYNQRLQTAVKRFQARHGLKDDGIIKADVIKALNVPLDKRINQLQMNMKRVLQEVDEFPGTHIVANIPEYKLHVYEGNKEVLSMDIVVGKTTNKTAIFTDQMEQIVFSPYWNVPESIVKNEILPAMKKNPGYLRNNRMEIVGTQNGLPDIRQKPGAKNSLGKVKFLFPNKYNIYFHDTPAKTLFQKRTRAFSHGCIRLSKPFELAKYLLKDNPDWNDTAIQNAMNAGSEKWVKLQQPVPVSISYYTAWVDSEGNVNFRDDIYGYDKDLVKLD